MRMSAFLRWLIASSDAQPRVDPFAAKLQLLERAPEAIDVCEAQAEEAALFEAEGDPDGEEEDEGTSKPAPAAIAH